MAEARIRSAAARAAVAEARAVVAETARAAAEVPMAVAAKAPRAAVAVHLLLIKRPPLPEAFTRRLSRLVGRQPRSRRPWLYRREVL